MRVRICARLRDCEADAAFKLLSPKIHFSCRHNCMRLMHAITLESGNCMVLALRSGIHREAEKPPITKIIGSVTDPVWTANENVHGLKAALALDWPNFKRSQRRPQGGTVSVKSLSPFVTLFAVISPISIFYPCISVSIATMILYHHKG
jgi:hypothetical protein